MLDRKQFIKNNPPDAYGYYTCYLNLEGCWKKMEVSQMQVEHVHSKARRPDLRHNQENMKPACPNCNEKKRSKSLDELL